MSRHEDDAFMDALAEPKPFYAMKARIAELERQNQDLRAALRLIEWANGFGGDGTPFEYCIRCGGVKDRNGHKPECEVGRALAAAPPGGTE